METQACSKSKERGQNVFKETTELSDSTIKKITYLSLFIMIIFFSCSAQTKKDQYIDNIVTSDKVSSGNPKTDIKVNKRYDKKGNLISYDSTYTSYYSSRQGDTVLLDSLFREFKPVITKQFPLLNDMAFNTLFFNDSLLHDDFFHQDFFTKRFELNENYIKRMMMQMDSIKNNYFKTQSKQF